MTERIVLGKEKKLPWSFLKKCCFAYMAVFMLLLFFKCPDATSQWVKRGIETCVERLIPSLFPFMVVSALLLSSGVSDLLGKIFSKPFGFLFGIGAQGSAALLLGWICGFPIGARSASRLYADGKISEGEFERIVCISGTPSPAFLINVAGVSLLGDARVGIALYIICLVSCATVGIAMKNFCRSGEGAAAVVADKRKRRSYAVAFTRAVTDSAQGMLYVCGFVIFFSAFVGALDSFVSTVAGNMSYADTVFGFFEITVGLTRLAETDLPRTVMLSLCAAVSAWSGMSVHLQVISLCADGGFPIMRYFIANAAKAAVAALAMIAAIGLKLL